MSQITSTCTCNNVYLLADGEFQTIVNNNGWTMDNGVVYIRSQEEHIKPKRILPKIDFDSKLDMVHS